MKKEIYWYEDLPGWKIIIGVRGGSEYSMNLSEFRKEWLRNGFDHKFSDISKSAEIALKIVMKESQYVDFEEVVTIPKQLNG